MLGLIATPILFVNAFSPTVFALIVGQKWFSEFKSLEENTLQFKPLGVDQPLTVTFTMKDVEIPI